MAVSGIDLGKYKLGWHDTEQYVYEPKKGLNEDVVREISHYKSEPEWMTKFRLNALKRFERKPMLEWFAKNMPDIDFDDIYYYLKPTEGQVSEWDMHPEIMREHFGTVIPPGDNKFAALNSAVWSGGSFIYVPPGVRVELPLQAYFRINAENMGQFERTLILVDESAYVHYVEGCTAPIYSTDSLHSAVVEIHVAEGGRCRYTTIQNWSTNVYNLVTKRAVAEKNATMEWVDGNLGSQITQKYPAVLLNGEGAHGEVLSIAFAGKGQHQDAGGKMTHMAPNTSSVINSKSISKDGGRASYRGLLQVNHGAVNSRSKVVCDALILDDESRTDTYPYIDIKENAVDIGHEATVSKIGEEQLFYLMSRGLTEEEASAMVVSGFIEPIVKELPLEYAVEMNRLIQLQMEGSVG